MYHGMTRTQSLAKMEEEVGGRRGEKEMLLFNKVGNCFMKRRDFA